MKIIFIFCKLIFILNVSFAQEPVTNRQGREVMVNTPASNNEKGIIKLAGDLGGTADVPNVVKIQNISVSPTSPTNGQVLQYNGINWAPFTLSATEASSPFNFVGTNNDAGNNKSSMIWRSGGLLLGSGISSTTTYPGILSGQANFSSLSNIFEMKGTDFDNPVGLFFTNEGLNSSFLPRLNLSSSGSYKSIFSSTAFQDLGNEPVMQFSSVLSNGNSLFSRPTFTWMNGNNEQMRITADGKLGINNMTPNGRIVIDDKYYISSLPSSPTNLQDISSFRPHTRFQNTVGNNYNALSLYSTTSGWGVQTHNYTTGSSLPFILQPAGGNIGVGISSPVSTFANTSTSIQGSNVGSSTNVGITWVSADTGFVSSFYNSNVSGNGMLLKLAGTSSSNIAFEVATGAQSENVDSPLFNVKGNGNVGINKSSPEYHLDVNGTARIVNTPTITNALKGLVKDPLTGQISEQLLPTGGSATGGSSSPKTIFVNQTSPISSTTFSLTFNPVVHEESLKQIVGNIYVGTDGSFWTWNGSNYITYSVSPKYLKVAYSNANPNFYVSTGNSDFYKLTGQWVILDDNTGGDWNSTDSRFVCSRPGYYNVVASLGFVNGVKRAGVQYNVAIYKNGVRVSRQNIFVQAQFTGSIETPKLVDMIRLEQGDYLEVWVNVGSGAIDQQFVNSQAFAVNQIIIQEVR